MVGTLMYLTASRPDLTFAVCMCAWYQAKPTEKHLHAVKRIFKYLRGTVIRDSATYFTLKPLERKNLNFPINKLGIAKLLPAEEPETLADEAEE
ncbi:hypothetical protein Tco_1009549 [Tanacetum coccineum]